MSKKNWASSRQLLLKALHKDSLSVEAKYLLSRWFLNPENPSYGIDSAYDYSTQALHHYSTLPPREKERLRKFSIDSLVLTGQLRRIDSAAFQKVKLANEESAYQKFLDHYPHSPYADNVVELRNEVAYLTALRANTYQSFENYLKKYPDSRRYPDAKAHYEKLLFEQKTRDRTKESLLSFIRDYPNSPYRHQAEKEVFELMTLDGSIESFASFIDQFPSGGYSNFARNIIYYLHKEDDTDLPDRLYTDSLRRMEVVNDATWVPVFKNSLYGFMDALSGKEFMSPTFSHIKPDYLCAATKDQLLETNEGIITRNGLKIARAGAVMEDIGSGFLKVSQSGCITLMHRSGREIVSECSDNFKIVGNRFIVRIVNKESILYSLTGRRLALRGDEILSIGNCIVVSRLGKYYVFTYDGAAKSSSTDYVFDNVLNPSPGQLIVKNGSLEGIMDANLNFTHPLERQTFTITPNGVIRQRNGYFSIVGISSELDQLDAQSFSFHDEWIVLKQQQNLKLFNMRLRKIVVDRADSVWFGKQWAFSKTKDSTSVNFRDGHQLKMPGNTTIQFIPSASPGIFYYVEVKNKKVVYDAFGSKLFTAEFDQIEYLTKGIFLLTENGKKKLVKEDGKALVSMDFDNLLMTDSRYITILKQGKFGLYRFETPKFIKPEFDKNISVLADGKLAACKNNLWGIVDFDLKQIEPFQYDEINKWSDSVVWVKRNFLWTLMNYYTGKILLDKIKDFKTWRVRNEDLAIVHRDNFYGVVSNSKGVLIPPTFNDIQNVGSEEVPVYLADKEVEEASVHVVVYYNKYGKLIRRQIFEEEEFARIACDEN